MVYIATETKMKNEKISTSLEVTLKIATVGKL